MELRIMTKAIREILGISQRRLSEMVGTTQSEISLIESGFIPPDPLKIQAILRIFNKIKEGEHQ